MRSTLPRLVDPPAGSDLTEEWQFFLGLAKRMKLDLWFVNFFGGGGGRFMESPPVVINMNGDTELTTEELFEQMCSTSRIPLAEVRSHPHGKIFDVDGDSRGAGRRLHRRLDVGNADMLADLADVSGRGLQHGAKRFRVPVPAGTAPARQLHELVGHQPGQAEPGHALQPHLHASGCYCRPGTGFR